MSLVTPEHLIQAIRGANLEPLQLGPRPQPSWIGRIGLPGSCLDFARLGPAMSFAGVMPRDCYTLIFVLDCPDNGHAFNFSVTHGDGYLGFFPPGALIDAITPAGYANATLTVPAAAFHGALPRFFPGMPDKVLRHGAGVRVGQAEQARLRDIIGVLKHALEDAGGPLADAAALAAAEDELLPAFLDALRSGFELRTPQHGRREVARARHFRIAREYLAANVHRPVYLRQVAAELGVSTRTVESLFKGYCGVSPLTYLRHQRLHGARQALLGVRPGPGVVKRTALNWGFLHQGRFAREYRDLFGESPLETASARA